MASKIHVTGISSLITLRITTSGIILLVKKDYRNISVIDNFSAREWSGSLRLLQQFINTEQGDARHFLAHRTYMVQDTATTFRLPASSSLQTIQAHTHSNRHSRTQHSGSHLLLLSGHSIHSDKQAFRWNEDWQQRHNVMSALLPSRRY